MFINVKEKAPLSTLLSWEQGGAGSLCLWEGAPGSCHPSDPFILHHKGHLWASFFSGLGVNF